MLKLLGAERIGIEMSDEFQLHPEQSTSAIIVHHPEAIFEAGVEATVKAGIDPATMPQNTQSAIR